MDNDELLIAIKDMFEKNIEEVKNEVADVKNHTGVLIERLEDDIKAIAEGHSVIDRKIDNLEMKVDNLQNNMDRKIYNLQKDMDIVKNYVIAVDTKLNEHEVILKRIK